MRIAHPIIVFLITFSILALSPVIALSAKSKDVLKKEQGEKPIEIQSDKLRSENEGKKFIFSGNVFSVWGDLEIKSDVLEVYSNSKKQTGQKSASGNSNPPDQDLDKVIAIGNVKIKKGDRRAQGDRAHYDNKKQIIIITGKPNATAWEGENIIRGNKMIFVMEKDLFKVEGRVNVVLNPKKSNKKR